MVTYYTRSSNIFIKAALNINASSDLNALTDSKGFGIGGDVNGHQNNIKSNGKPSDQILFAKDTDGPLLSHENGNKNKNENGIKGASLAPLLSHENRNKNKNENGIICASLATLSSHETIKMKMGLKVHH
ncbi:MAG: hypothetical protein GY755_00005 [Chloroflexi bacterium]|nr:hypothetical protein [Chloroflexota bacterium]